MKHHALCSTPVYAHPSNNEPFQIALLVKINDDNTEYDPDATFNTKPCPNCGKIHVDQCSTSKLTLCVRYIRPENRYQECYIYDTIDYLKALAAFHKRAIITHDTCRRVPFSNLSSEQLELISFCK